MADSEAELVNVPPETLVTEIDRTREDLARTIDAISDRLSPASITRRGVARIREQVSQIDPRLAGAAAAVVATGVAVYFWRRRKR